MSGDAGFDSLSLTDALLRWGDPALIEAVRVNDVMISKTVIEERGRPVLVGHPMSGTEWTQIPLAHRTRALAMYDEAWRRLIRDFKARIERDELFLAGVSTKNSSNTVRATIPGLWAADLTFDFTANVVTRNFDRFIAIRVSKEPIVPDRDAADATRIKGDEPDIVAVHERPALRPLRDATGQSIRGRSSYTAIIREAATDKWDQICAGDHPAETWNAIAGWLLKHLRQKYPERIQLNQLPAHGTIRTRITRIYEEISDSRGVQ